MEITVKIIADPALMSLLENVAKSLLIFGNDLTTAADRDTAAPMPMPVYPAPLVSVAPAQPLQAPVAAPVTAPIVPTSAPAYTLDQLSVAGAVLAESGKREDIRSLLGRYGVAALTQLPKEQYGAVAMDLRAIGGKI